MYCLRDLSVYRMGYPNDADSDPLQGGMVIAVRVNAIGSCGSIVWPFL